MIDSIRANYMRMFRCRSFYLLLIASFLTPIYLMREVVGHVAFYEKSFIIQVSDLNYVLLLLIAANSYIYPVFLAFYIGQEIRDRGWARKISTGTGKVKVYLSQVLTLIPVALLTLSLNIISLFAFCHLTKGKFRYTWNWTNVRYIIFLIVWVIAMVLFNCLLQSCFSIRIFSLIISLMLTSTVISLDEAVMAKLYEPYRVQFTDNLTGEEFWDINPDYISGGKRKVYTFLSDINPYTYVYDYTENGKNTDKQFRTQFLSAVTLSSVSTALGSFIFRRKDFK